MAKYFTSPGTVALDKICGEWVRWAAELNDIKMQYSTRRDISASEDKRKKLQNDIEHLQVQIRILEQELLQHERDRLADEEESRRKYQMRVAAHLNERPSIDVPNVAQYIGSNPNIQGQCALEPISLGTDFNGMQQNADEQPERDTPDMSHSMTHHDKTETTVEDITALHKRRLVGPSNLKSDADTRAKRTKIQETINFEEVWDGTSQPAHFIVSFPKNSDNWFILYCQQHNLTFGSNPLVAAAKHLNGSGHGGLSKHHCVAVRELGIRVLDCDSTKAGLSNRQFITEQNRTRSWRNRTRASGCCD